MRGDWLMPAKRSASAADDGGWRSYRVASQTSDGHERVRGMAKLTYVVMFRALGPDAHRVAAHREQCDKPDRFGEAWRALRLKNKHTPERAEGLATLRPGAEDFL